MAEAALDQKLGTLLKMHEEAFRQLGGVPEEILYDRMKTVWVEADERGDMIAMVVIRRGSNPGVGMSSPLLNNGSYL